MYKLIAGLLLMVSLASASSDDIKCSLEIPLISKEWVDMHATCMGSMRDQIQREIDASFVYLAMGAYFSRDTVNRPGFAEFFFNSAREERQHGSKLIEYLSMRGELTDNITTLLNVPVVIKHEWADGVTALEDALQLEIKVTRSIRKLIHACEKNNNDYHLVDWLTAEYLDEQHKGQRELAGLISTLKKMMKTHGHLGEFLFDKNNMVKQ